MEGETLIAATETVVATSETVIATSSVIASSPKPPSSPKEEKGNVSPKNERQSPEPNCAICLGKSENKSFTDSCLHQFCFSCLLEWSRVKPECPLCKQGFKSIIHNVRSNEDYDQYHLRPPETNAVPIWNVNVNIESDIRRFHYRTTLIERYRPDRNYIQNWTPPILLNRSTLPSHSGVPNYQRRLATCDFRRSVYERDLWVNPLSDITGRYRDCSPEFYRLNPAQMHRLVPWLNRELGVLLNVEGARARAMEVILHLLPLCPIHSMEFRTEIIPFFGPNTSHFLHEFFEFARSPYDMIGFDQAAEYVHISSFPIVVPSSSSDDDSDSDVIVLSSGSGSDHTTMQTSARDFSTAARDFSTAARDFSTAGPSGARRLMNFVFSPIHSDGDSSSSSATIDVTNESNRTVTTNDPDDCMIVGYVKPRHERTPEIITLDSDEDDVIEDGEFPPPSNVMRSCGYESNQSEYTCLDSSSGEDDSYDSDFVPNRRKKVNRKKTSSVSRQTKGSTGKAPLKKRCKRVVSPSSSSSSSACEHLKKRTKPLISSDSSDDEDSVKSSRKREIWRIMKNQRLNKCREPAMDHDYSVDFSASNNYDAPYSSSGGANFSVENKPKLRSIIITRSAAERGQSHSLSPVPSTSSHRSSSHKRKHKSSGKKEDKRRRKGKRRSSSSSVSPSHSSKTKKRKRKRSRRRSTSMESSS